MMIESVYDKTSSQKISATDLQKMPDVFTSIKRLGSILVCQECEGEVIARRGPGVKHFAHRAGQGENCKWVTGKTRTKGHVSANIHNGKQKGSLHQVIQEEFYDVLGRAGYQVHKPDAYFKLYEQPKFGRYPDIRVTCNNIDIVFEFQIRAIQVPDIKERTDYYKHPEVKMHWVLHDVDMNNLKSFEWDVVAAQGGVVLSVDDETREITKNSNKLTLRVSYLDFDVAKNGSVILVWKSKLEKFDDFTQNGAAQKRMLLAKTCVKNCHKLRLFEYLPLVDTVEYHLKNFASKERQDRFVKYWLELVKSKQEEKYDVYSKKYASALKHVAKLTSENENEVLKLLMYEDFFKVMCMFVSFQTSKIHGFRFRNFKELMNNFISNQVYHRWLPILIPTILKYDELPSGFDKHLAKAISFVDDDTAYTELTSKIITFFMPSLLSTNLLE